MKVRYQLRSGAVLILDVENNGLLLNNMGAYKSISINGKIETASGVTEEKKYQVHKEKSGRLYVETSERVYLDQFSPKYTYAELVCVLNNTDTRVCLDDIFATFIRYQNEICIVMDILAADVVIPLLGISVCGNNYIKTAVIPASDSRYEPARWYYKMEFMNLFEELRCHLPKTSLYFMDLVTMLRNGSAKLVLKDALLSKMQEVASKASRPHKKNRGKKEGFVLLNYDGTFFPANA